VLQSEKSGMCGFSEVKSSLLFQEKCRSTAEISHLTPPPAQKQRKHFSKNKKTVTPPHKRCQNLITKKHAQEEIKE